jgi:hypothetical protein
MKRSVTVSQSIAIAATLGAALALSVASGTFAAGNPAGTGQPSVECGDEGAALEPNGFLTEGFEQAESVYAGEEEAQSAVSDNSHAVSQYDVACFQFTSSR